ncbi:hypothetical protein [Thiocystis violacea]|uniref:hypothetical protein n=1 Tax=Thiocystis violacea TaxID=13725 RepID=UPI0019067100|nr:hypothetical protein [Thiocystis violacea]
MNAPAIDQAECGQARFRVNLSGVDPNQRYLEIEVRRTLEAQATPGEIAGVLAMS